MNREDFYQKKSEVALLLMELNSYAKSKVIDDFATDLRDIDIDDSVNLERSIQSNDDDSDELDEGIQLIDGVLVDQKMRDYNYKCNCQVFENCKTMVNNGEYEKAIETIQNLKYYCENLKMLHLAAIEMWGRAFKKKAS